MITEVSIENSYVRIAEQNVENNYWPRNDAREFKLEVIGGCYLSEIKMNYLAG